MSAEPRPDLRASPRLDVVDQIRGQLVSFGVQLLIREISFGGFSTEGPVAFEPGDQHTFRFTTLAGRDVLIRARVIYSRDLGRFRGLPFYVTGFAFIEDPHRDTPGDINVLIDAVTAALRFHDHEPTAASASEGH
jgi:hypothetical protein